MGQSMNAPAMAPKKAVAYPNGDLRETPSLDLDLEEPVVEVLLVLPDEVIVAVSDGVVVG